MPPSSRPMAPPAPAHAGPDAERPVARRAHGERRGDQGEGRRSRERGAGALHGARREQPPLGGGEAADQRGRARRAGTPVMKMRRRP